MPGIRQLALQDLQSHLVEGVSYLDGFPVGEPSRSRCSRSAGALGGFHTRIRAGFPRVVHRQAVAF